MPAPRLSHFSYAGFHRYFLTFRTAGRARHFSTPAVVGEVLSQFRLCAALDQFAVLAYCFMPEHLHLLVAALSESASLGRFVASAKQRTGHWFSRQKGVPLWQQGFADHALPDEDITLAAVRYVLANPVRAGLAREIGAYPFAGSDVFSAEEIGHCLQMWTPPWRRPRHL